MKAFLSAVLALALVVASTLVPAQASYYLPTPEDMVRWAGCSATLVTSPLHSPFESFYDPDSNRLYFGTRPEPGLDPDAPLQILMHEAAHCLKTQEEHGWAGYPKNPVAYELEADERGADLLCRDYRDGARINHDLLVYVNERYGYEGDDTHGTLAQRIAAGYSAPACAKPGNPGA